MMTIAHAGTILLVEADAALQHDMGAFLEHAGHKLLLAATGGEALRVAREHSPDLVVAHARLPDTDGMTLCRRLKNDPALSQVPVIMLDGAPISAEKRTAALRAGVDEYLELPIPDDLLLAYVDAKLRLKKSGDALREALAYAQSILASMRELMLVLDADLHVISANRAFYHFFHATPAETEGKSLFELGGGAWDIPELRRLLENILPHNASFNDFDVTHSFLHIGARTMLLNARRISREGEQTQMILLAMEDVTQRRRSERELVHKEASIRATLLGIGDAVIATDKDGRVDFMNPVAEKLTGWTEVEAFGRPLSEVFPILNEETLLPVESPVERVLRDGIAVGLANHTLLISRSGRKIPIADSGAPIFDGHGTVTGVVLIFRDQTEERMRQYMMETRLELSEYSMTHGVDEVLRYALDLTEKLVESSISFYHFMEDGGQHIALQEWSSRTQEEFCQAEGRGRHYDLEQAGVWTDAVHQKRPVIHNDYLSLPCRKGLPPGHAPLLRELVVPVLREGEVVAVMGVGNKPDDYSPQDVELVSYLADVVWEIVSRQRAAAEVQEGRRFLEMVFDAIQDGISVLNPDLTIRLVNRTMEKWFSESMPLVGKKCFAAYHFREAPCEVCPTRTAMATRRAASELVPGLPGTEVDWIELFSFPILDEEGNLTGVVEFVRDITELRRSEEEREHLLQQLYHAQKMEAIGRLAGGVAHDFNNMLSVILGYAEIVQKQLREGDPLLRDVAHIVEAAQRSARLTRQLLSVSRHQPIHPEVIDLNELIVDVQKMLARVIGEDVELVLRLSPDVHAVKVDLTQMEQVLLNLAVNAREAMVSGGRLVIETHNIELDEEYARRHAGVAPGEYVLLMVTDTGCGMDEEVMSHVFEPFFTTKEGGTGLGLSVVYGIVKRAGGDIWAYSEPGVGTTFKIYLPSSRQEVRAQAVLPTAPTLLGRGERILVVEDEDSVRDFIQRMLTQLGYSVTTAANGDEAIGLIEEKGECPDLILSDVVMPVMRGAELVEHVRASFPQAKALLMSGYSDQALEKNGVLERGIPFIQKPFTIQALAQKVREVLEGD